MDKDQDIFKSLIAGGIIGGALGALLSKKSGEGSFLGAIAGAVILATYKANENAKKTKLPLFIEEDNKLYELKPDGSKVFIKNLEKPSQKLSNQFKLA